jgi:hypothetical protein
MALLSGPVQGDPAHVNHRLDIAALAGEHHLHVGPEEMLLVPWGWGLALVRGHICHVSSGTCFRLLRDRAASKERLQIPAFYSGEDRFIFSEEQGIEFCRDKDAPRRLRDHDDNQPITPLAVSCRHKNRWLMRALALLQKDGTYFIPSSGLPLATKRASRSTSACSNLSKYLPLGEFGERALGRQRQCVEQRH